MHKTLFFIISVVIGLTFEAGTKVRSLCDDPVINAADRLTNETVRVYRGNYYWELVGLPDRVAKVNGPFKINYQYMAPVRKNSSIMTVLSGPIAGNTWKFEGEKYWQWNENGELEIGGKNGAKWKEITRGGFHCAMNSGNYDHRGYPMLIALKAIKAYYWKTTQKIFQPIGDIYNGYINGQFNEQFPADVTSCMAFKTSEDTDQYYIYLFKRDTYCFRPITGEDGCNEWRSSRELFGCSKDGNQFEDNSDGTDDTDSTDSTDADYSVSDGNGSDGDGTDGDGTDGDGTDGDGTDSGGTDSGGTDADGTDAGSTDADGTDADYRGSSDGNNIIDSTTIDDQIVIEADAGQDSKDGNPDNEGNHTIGVYVGTGSLLWPFFALLFINILY